MASQRVRPVAASNVFNPRKNESVVLAGCNGGQEIRVIGRQGIVAELPGDTVTWNGHDRDGIVPVGKYMIQCGSNRSAVFVKY